MEDFKKALVMDFYELTMSNVYLKQKKADEEAIFELFYRKNPDNAAYSIFAGLEEAINFILNLKFTESDIKYLRELNTFDEEFLNYLANFKFKGDIWSVKEGEIIFPKEPLMIIKAKLIDAQLIETALLLNINHETLIATKANRIKYAAKNKEIIEMGARRAHGYDASIYGARASYIGGTDKTANTIASKLFNIPVAGTMAHSYIQSFNKEEEAFLAYAKTYPDNAIFLIDTYDTLNSGLVNAIKVHNEYLKPLGKELKGVRIDSGDIAYLSKKIRARLDEEGMKNTKIIVSNSLNENLIVSLEEEQAKVDIYGVGENLIVSKSNPVLGAVYKLVAIYENGVLKPKIKKSENIEKITNPYCKRLYRIYDQKTKVAIADFITCYDEEVNDKSEIEVINDTNMYARKKYKKENIILEELLVNIVKDGELIYQFPKLKEIKEYKTARLKLFAKEIKRFNFPQTYHIGLSTKLTELKFNLLEQIKK